MTLRSCGRDTVPMIGPRSRAVGAPQLIGKRCLAPGAGCEVRRIWSVRLETVMAAGPKCKCEPKTSTARRFATGLTGNGGQSKSYDPRGIRAQVTNIAFPTAGYNEAKLLSIQVFFRRSP